jgi:hypothetical protein
MNSDFPFSDTPDTACFTCCHITDGQRPIRFVSHDEDGYWQFLCGSSHSTEEARIVSLAEILKLDGSVAAFAALDLGEFAEAQNGHNDWVVKTK